MRLQTLYFIGAFAVMAIPLSAGAQSLPANEQPGNHQWTSNAQADKQAAQKCPRGMIGSRPDISGVAHGALPSAGRAVRE
jgi:hypothetical protein